MQLSGYDALLKEIPWWFSGRITPVPIPNTAVKTTRSDNTWTVRSWKDSFPPRVIIREAHLLKSRCVFFGDFFNAMACVFKEI